MAELGEAARVDRPGSYRVVVAVLIALTVGVPLVMMNKSWLNS